MIPKDFIVYDKHALPWVRVSDGLPSEYSEVVVHGEDCFGDVGETMAYIKPDGEWFIFDENIEGLKITHWFYLTSPTA